MVDVRIWMFEVSINISIFRNILKTIHGLFYLVINAAALK